ncbi:SGT1 protein-domain-containing protein [Truncatella angustata]|uniref:SGT1 protein-domain-containing protein n=1 Tax=Truncatella angustata TaxID=152316 RepID=A0A9P8UKM7_9PEZI|nr:SGT1 protein-domain-containing protein [Truncatella angustata]KAH6653722.1 SGT1 protein-domain-containing protein [Truncatella angustata]
MSTPKPTSQPAMPPGDRVDFFQDGFDGFPRRLPENCVEYIIFVIDSQLEARKLLSALEAVRKAAVQLTETLTKEYIWQRDGLQLEVKTDKHLLYLQGTSYYGDSVEDEWLIVYLLRELTKSHPNLWVRVFDSDGEFLLVEAANVLPNWLSPEVDSNRVWIHQGKLHIIPLRKGSHDKRPLTLAESVHYLKSEPTSSLVHSTFIEAEAFYRLDKYPGQIAGSLHHSVITIPRKLAYILHEMPAAIAPAVEAFYLRDPVSMKSLLSPSGKLSFPPKDLVTVSAKFTKVLFAQLKSQRFTQPPVWVPIVEAAEKGGTGAEKSQKALDQLEIGMKVTSGFEMLAVNAETKDNRIAREVAILLEDLEEDGDQSLPSDATIQAWPNVNRDDDESWMDINYEDFEKELDGKSATKGGKNPGFGDSTAQADLQKIVSRFESFLNDDTAGLEGAELNDMDLDDDDELSDDDDGEEDSEDEDKDVSFDEEQFARMMREMMGMPSVERPTPSYSAKSLNKPGRTTLAEEPDDEHEDDDDEAIRQLAAQMESELNEHGALQLDPTPKKLKALREKDVEDTGKGKGTEAAQSDGEESGDDEVDIDYNLAKNLLESFKGQAGMAGPAGNILGMMGMKLPRDEHDEDKE